MLILDIQNKFEKEKKSFFRKNKIRNQSFERKNFKYNNKVHTIVSIPENMLESEDFIKLMKMFKGQVLACDDSRINDLVEPYLFNAKPYFKEAVFSSLYNLVSSDKSVKTICIKDDNFKITSNLLNLVKVCKNLVLETEQTIELQRFCDECYMNYGAFINVTAFYKNRGEGIYFNTDDIDFDGKGTIFIDGKESIIYPDPKYFCCDEMLKGLLKYGISIKIICAAFSNVC